MSFCGSSQGGTTANTNQYVDPLGPSSLTRLPNGQSIANYSASGAPQMRTSLFNYLKGQTPSLEQAGQAAGSAATEAANNPGWAEAQAQAQKNINGDYLAGSPQLDAAMNQNQVQQLRASADQNAQAASKYALNGMDFSTAHDQAAQANTAAAASSAANTNAQTYLQNYLAERTNQNNGATQLQTATNAPLSYLNQVSANETAPLTQIGNIISGLSSGGQVVGTGGSTQQSDNPSTGSDIMNGFSVLGNL